MPSARYCAISDSEAVTIIWRLSCAVACESYYIPGRLSRSPMAYRWALESSSGSTEYFSIAGSQFGDANPGPSFSDAFASVGYSTGWMLQPEIELLAWSDPIALEHSTSQCSKSTVDCPQVIEEGSCSHTAADTPVELRYTLTQEEVDRDMAEMTCGPTLEEHFWPIRYQIRHGKLHAYEVC
ncbi:hypothetical protein K438DRAFT_355638 [Mycena galopus ATCC 62051]|nr:hypothetical protein K438DRAFT_355638 [Mycena galopus ATCC 62051]